MNKLVILFFLIATAPAQAALKDSIGVERTAGRLYILHRVEAKETLYSLSRRYHVPVDEIMAANPQVKEGLKIDAIVKIPGTEKTEPQPGNAKHIVQPSETLYAIARKYGVELEELASVNGLEGYNLKVGQELIIPAVKNQKTRQASGDAKNIHIVKDGETLYSISRTYNVGIDEIKRWNGLTDNTLKPGQTLTIGEKPAATAIETKIEQPVATVPAPATEEKPAVQPAGYASTEVIKRYDIEDNEYLRKKSETSEPVRIEKVYENGLAEVMAGSEDTKKYLALHKTAPVGTILQVKNEMNNQSVFVRVIGKLPDTGDNEKISIRISRIAYERLGAIDARFPVEISYIPR